MSGWADEFKTKKDVATDSGASENWADEFSRPIEAQSVEEQPGEYSAMPQYAQDIAQTVAAPAVAVASGASRILDFYDALIRRVKGGEGSRQLASTMLGGAVGEVAGGVAGVGATPFGADVAADTVRATREALTPDLGPEGAQAAQTVGGYVPDTIKGVAAEVPRVINEYADATLDATGSPMLASAVKALPTAAAMAAGPMLGRAVKAIPPIPHRPGTAERALVAGTSDRAIAPVLLPSGRASGFDTRPPVGNSMRQAWDAASGTAKELVGRGKSQPLSRDPSWGVKGTAITTRSGRPGQAGAGTVSDPVAKTAIQQGMKEGSVAGVKVMAPETRRTARKMVATLEKGIADPSKRLRIRASDHVGQALYRRVRIVQNAKKQAGNAIDDIAKGMKDTPIDVAPAMTRFADDMEKLGVRFNVNRTVEQLRDGVKAYEFLENSPLQGLPGVERIIKNLVAKMRSVNVSNGYGVHQFKVHLSERVNFKNAKEGIPGRLEAALKSLRHDLNTSLQKASKPYKDVNTIYSKAKQALDDLDSAAGKSLSKDLPEQALGQELRKLASNYNSRTDLLSAMDGMEKLAKLYSKNNKALVPYGAKPSGARLGEEVTRLAQFANDLEDMFGSQATNSFHGIQAQVVAKGVRDAATQGTTATLARAALDKIAGGKKFNEAEALRAIKELLKDGN